MPVAEPFLGSVTITGPFNIRGPGDTPSRRRILVCRPASAVAAGSSLRPHDPDGRWRAGRSGGR